MSEAAATVAMRRSWRSLVIAGVGGAVLLGATLALWAYYGTTVFYEMILAGIAFCL